MQTETSLAWNKHICYRGIINERSEDAPFIGALIIAANCSNRCKNCFNQHLKAAKLYCKDVESIIAEVKQNVFNEGIILGGLEWSEQPDEAIALIRCAIENNLKVILYTGLTEPELFKRIPPTHLYGCYVKFGKYDCNKAVTNYTSFGVALASSNQYINFIQ